MVHDELMEVQFYVMLGSPCGYSLRNAETYGVLSGFALTLAPE